MQASHSQNSREDYEVGSQNSQISNHGREKWRFCPVVQVSECLCWNHHTNWAVPFTDTVSALSSMALCFNKKGILISVLSDKVWLWMSQDCSQKSKAADGFLSLGMGG